MILQVRLLTIDRSLSHFDALSFDFVIKVVSGAGQDENDADFAASYSLIGEIHLCEWRAELHRCEAGQVPFSEAFREPDGGVRDSQDENVFKDSFSADVLKII